MKTMIQHHGPKALVLFGMGGEFWAMLTTDRLLGAASFAGTAITAASTWYWTEKSRKRKDRQDEHLNQCMRKVLKAITDRQAATIHETGQDPFPEVTRILLERGDGESR